MAFYSTYQIGELDKVAYHVLAVSYSGIYIDNFNVQRYIGQPCIGVAYCQGCLFIAANNVWRSQGPGVDYPQAEVPANVGNTNVFAMICHSLRAGGIIAPIRFLENPLGECDTTYHAELQLIDFVYILSNSHFDGNILGVSKPCCQFCANELHERGIAITDFHGAPTNAHRPGNPLQIPRIYGSC